MIDAAVQHQARHRVHRTVLLRRRAGSRHAREVDGRARVHERQQHELGETSRVVLHAREGAQVADPMVRSIHVPVHHRARRTNAQAMRGADDLDPLGSGQLALREHPPHLVIENLGGRARNRVEPRLFRRRQEVGERQPGAGCSVHDFHRTKRVQVNARLALLHFAREVEVGRAGKVGVDSALHANLGRAERPRLIHAIADLLHREREGISIGAPLSERAEPAARVTDVREVDVAVDDVSDLVADRVAAHSISEVGERVKVGAVGREQGQVVRVAQAGGGILGPTQHRRDARAHGDGCPPRPARIARLPGRRARAARLSCRDRRLAQLGPVAVDVVEVAASFGAPTLGVDLDVQVGASGAGAARPIGVRLLPRDAPQHGCLVGQPIGPGQGPHVRNDARVEPRLFGAHVVGVRGQTLVQREP